MKINIDEFEHEIGIIFSQKKHLIEALSHFTYLEENPNFINEFGLVDGHNQRLEHLGDSVLGHIIAEKLYYNHPGREGELTDLKTYFVNGNKLEEISDKIGLEKFLIMGIGESKNELGREKRIRDSLEALIAAIYLDQGYEKAKVFVDKFFLYNLDNILKNIGELKIINNPIGYLQEYCVEKGYGNPIYTVSDNEGVFLAEVKIDSKKSAKGMGKNKPDARKDAAINAIKP